MKDCKIWKIWRYISSSSEWVKNVWISRMNSPPNPFMKCFLGSSNNVVQWDLPRWVVRLYLSGMQLTGSNRECLKLFFMQYHFCFIPSFHKRGHIFIFNFSLFLTYKQTILQHKWNKLSITGIRSLDNESPPITTRPGLLNIIWKLCLIGTEIKLFPMLLWWSIRHNN